jgi:AraC-like DNA-binding protein
MLSLAERLARPDFDIRVMHGEAGIENPHRHEYFQVQLHLSGRATHEIGTRRLNLERGSFCFVLPYAVHRAGRFPGSKFWVINFASKFLRSLADVHPLDLQDVPLEQVPLAAPFLFQERLDYRVTGSALETAERLCADMAQENDERRFCSGDILQAHLTLLIGLVCRTHERALLDLAAGQAQLVMRRDALGRVTRYIREHMSSGFKLEEAAAAVHLSPNYLTHLLKRETGQTFVELVTARRMERARDLLERTPLPIAAIAREVGFEDAAYFTRRFRQWFKSPPSKYRARVTRQRTRSTRHR